MTLEDQRRLYTDVFNSVYFTLAKYTTNHELARTKTNEIVAQVVNKAGRFTILREQHVVLGEQNEEK